MVDLVKIRKKSKKAAESASDGSVSSPSVEAAPPAEPSAPPAAPQTPSGAASAVDTVEPAPTTAEPQEKAEAGGAAKPKKQAKGASKEPAAEPPNEVRATAASAPAADAEPDLASEDRLAKFKRLAGKRRTWTATPTTAEQIPAVGETAGLELLRFNVAGEEYAVDIEQIVEIVPPRGTTRVPNAGEAIVGIMSLRGTIVTVIDLRRKLGHPRVELAALKDPRMIVVERAGETAGFLVDRVSRVVKLDRAQLESHPVVSSSEQSEYVSGVFQAQDGLVILLDIERILAG